MQKSVVSDMAAAAGGPVFEEDLPVAEDPYALEQQYKARYQRGRRWGSIALVVVLILGAVIGWVVCAKKGKSLQRGFGSVFGQN